MVDQIFSRVQNVSDLRLSRSTLARMLSFAKRLNGILQCLHADKSQRCSRSVAPIRVADRGGASSRATVHCTPPEIFPHRWQLAGFPGDLRQLAGALPTVSDAHTAAVGPMLPLRRCMAWKGSELAGRLSDETRSALEHRMNAKGAIVPSKECRRQGGDIAGIGVRLFCPHPRRPWHRLNEPSLINAMTQPKSRSAIDTAKGNTQLPVRSTINPKASGDTIAATADPVFISPEPIPAYCGAMSIGIDQIGPITSSRQKNPAAKKRASSVKLAFVNTRPKQIVAPTITLRRAACASPVRRRIASLIIPPEVSPTTPAKNTADENNAAFLRSKL